MQENKKKSGFFRTLFKSINILRLVIINAVFFLFLFMVLDLIGQIPASKKTVRFRVPNEATLCINPVGFAVESEKNIFTLGFSSLGKKKAVIIPELSKSIKNAAFDRRIKALYMDFSEVRGLSPAHLTELASSLEQFKASKKPIYCYSTSYSIPSYFLASYAERIGLDPLGEVSFAGFASRPIFFKGVEEKFGIKWNVLHAGEYKGMAETYSREEISDNVRSNLKNMFDDLWSTYTSSISKNRNIPQNIILNYAENYADIIKKYNGDASKAALNEQLVTDIASVDAFAANIGLADSKTFEVSSEIIDYVNYNLNFTDIPSPNSIGVIHLSGAITSMQSAGTQEAASSPKIVELFDMAQNDVSVKAVVLRVDSGGGEVFASEQIRRCLKRMQSAGKPVIVSMGSAAASGAYWISSAADYIFASPYTITGSIGVLGTAPSFENAVKNYLGITSSLVYSGQKPSHSPLKDPSQEEKETRLLEIMHIYKTFIQKVAEGRGLSLEAVENLAGGRVYSGNQALDLKLVDSIGSFEDAVEYAANLVNIGEQYSVKEIKKPAPFSERLLETILEDMDSAKICNMNLSDLKAFTDFLTLYSKKGIYVYNPEILIWE